MIPPVCEQAEYHLFQREKVEVQLPELYHKIGNHQNQIFRAFLATGNQWLWELSIAETMAESSALVWGLQGIGDGRPAGLETGWHRSVLSRCSENKGKDLLRFPRVPAQPSMQLCAANDRLPKEPRSHTPMWPSPGCLALCSIHFKATKRAGTPCSCR